MAEKTIPGWETTWIGINEAKNKGEYNSVWSGPEGMATIVDLDPSTGEILRIHAEAIREVEMLCSIGFPGSTSATSATDP